MRTFSKPIEDKLSKKFGLNPTIFIGVRWKESEFFYCSTEFTGARKGIINVSGVETTNIISGSGTSQSVTVTLSDTDGHLTDVLNNVDIHKRPANVYLGFDDVPIDQSVTLLEGEINSDMVWDEKARTLTFTILNKIEGRLFGFAMEDGFFQKVNDSDRAKAWPFRFGDTCAYPAVKVQNGVEGLLREGQGGLDPTLDAKICQARKIRCPKIPDPNAELNEPASEEEAVQVAKAEFNKGLNVAIESGVPNNFDIMGNYGVKMSRPFNGEGRSALHYRKLNDDGDVVTLIPDYECQRNRFEKLCQLLRDRANQLVFVKNILQIYRGEEFPQAEPVRIRIGDVIYKGIFGGESFTIISTNRLDNPETNVECRDFGDPYLGYRKASNPAPDSEESCSQPTNTYELRVIGGAGDAWRQLDQMPNSEFKWLPAGTKVYLENSSTEVHVASLVPGTVTGVYAYRTLGDSQLLTEVPADYYTVVETDYGDLTAVEIHLTRSLNSYQDENWGDQLYVTFDSDIGPNPTDVIQWIVEKFTDYTVDASNFASVKTKLADYPCNYYHAEKEDVLATITRIAREARCAITLTDGVIKLTYLPEEPSQVKSFTMADLVNGTFSFELTKTESLRTSTDVTWYPWGAEQLAENTNERKFTVERNTVKYGVFPSTETYRTINNREQALKTATFWSIREANTYRRVKFKTTLEHMNLELFDCVYLDIPQFPSGKVVIDFMSVNVEQGTIDFEAWTPILSGTQTEYYWAWPANKPGKALYPSPQYANELEGVGLSMTPPEDHPLYVDDPNKPVPPTVGDRTPSDLDDEFPETFCQDMVDPILIDAIEPLFNELDFPSREAQQATRADEVAQNNPSYNFEEPDDNVACGQTTYETCVWEVNVGLGTATLVAPVDGGSGIGIGPNAGCGIQETYCKSYGRGQRCGGPIFNRCKVFGSELMANAYVASVKSAINAGFCNWGVGEQGPVYVTGPFERSSGPGPCVGMGSTEGGGTVYDPDGTLSPGGAGTNIVGSSGQFDDGVFGSGIPYFEGGQFDDGITGSGQFDDGITGSGAIEEVID